MQDEKHPENCKQVFALLSEYLDQELAPESCEELRKHLEHCAPCIEFLDSLKRSMRLCHDCGLSETPPPLTPAEKAELLAAYKRWQKRS